jgi:AraC-like DNA-binding protein
VLQILTDVVLTLTGFQLLLLALMLVMQLPRDLRRDLLVGFLLTKATLILRWFSFRFALIDPQQNTALYLCSATAFFLLAPLLAAHVRAVCSRDFRLRGRHLAHLVPAAAMLVAAVVKTASLGGASTGVAPLDELLANRFWVLFWTANLVQVAAYICAMLWTVKRYRRQLRRPLAPTNQFDLRWLLGLLAVLSLHWLFVTSRSLLGLLDVRAPQLVAALDVFSITIFLVFATGLVVRSLALVRVFPGSEQPAPANGSSLSPEQVRSVCGRLAAYMDRKKPHLEASLTLDELAAGLGMPSWQLSRVINSEPEQNFFHFVNRYRVEEARRQLADPAHNRKTMLQILHESGFNSKSTFNQAFKRHTSMTPSQFRLQAQQRRVRDGRHRKHLAPA